MNFKHSFLLMMVASLILASTGCKKDEDPNDKDKTNVQPLLLDCAYSSNTRLTDRNPNGVDYYATCMVEISGGTFTVEPGVTIAFESEGGLYVSGNGALSAIGTSTSPITFTTYNTVSSWAGLNFYSNNTSNELTYCVVERAGNDNQYTLERIFEPAAVNVNGRLRMTRTTVRNSKKHGLGTSAYGIAVTLSLPGFQQNTFEGNLGYPIVLEKDILNNMEIGTCTFTGNTNQMVKLINSSSRLEEAALEPTSAHTWQDAGIPYYMPEGIYLQDGANLTLEQGVHIKFASGTYIEISGDDSGNFLKATGTSSNQVVLEGNQTGQGTWDGLVYRSNNANNSLTYVTISNAGDNSEFTEVDSKGAIRVGNYLYTSLKLTLNNVTIQQSAGCGVAIYDYDGTGTMPVGVTFTETNVTYSGNADSDVCVKYW